MGKLRCTSALMSALVLMCIHSASAAPLGSAFTYQGRLLDNGGPATGVYELRLGLFNASLGGLQVGSLQTNANVAVSNGLFTTAVDFGAGTIDGTALWLEIGVRTNASLADFGTLAPRQPLTASPYALFAPNAGASAVAATANAVAPNSVTGTGIQNATITAPKIGAGQVVKTLNGLTDNVTLSAGAGLSLGGTIISANFGGTGIANTVAHSDHNHDATYAPLVHTHSAGDITSGTLSDARLSANVALLNTNQTFSGSNIFSGVVCLTNTANKLAGSFTGDGSGLTNLEATSLLGTLADARLSSNVPRLDANETFTGTVNFSPAAGSAFTVGNANKVNNLNADLLDGLDSSAFWKLVGNSGTSPGVNFLGTTDNQPLELQVNGARVLRLEPTTDTPNFIAGFDGNYVQPGLPGVTIGGGGTIIGNQPNVVTNNGYYATIAGGYRNAVGGYGGAILGGSVNTVSGDFGTIGGGQFHTTMGTHSTVGGGYGNQTGNDYSSVGGGYGNTADGFVSTIAGGNQNQASGDLATISGGYLNIIQASVSYATVGGGGFNTIQTNAGASTISGGQGNSIQTNASNSTIGGGSFNAIQSDAYDSTVGGGADNTIQANAGASTIGGGSENIIQTNAYGSTVAGGIRNVIQTNASTSTIAGGSDNTIQTNAYESTIGGGEVNTIQLNAPLSTIGGGVGNTIQANTLGSTISGGLDNTNTGGFAAIPGGDNNVAAERSFAAGHRAKALHVGAFVWADSTDADFASTSSSQFLIRASGGVGIGKNNPATALDVNGTVTASGFAGSGASLTSLNASSLASGTVADARLSPNVPSLNATETFTGAVTFNNAASSFSGNGANLTSLNASQLSSGSVPPAALGNAWQITGNTGTGVPWNFLGTTDNQPLEFKVNGSRALRLEPTLDDGDHAGIVNLVGGSSGNLVTPGVYGATIGGGGAVNYFGSSYPNSISGHFAAIGGGRQNTIQASATEATISGGFANTVQTGSSYAAIGGGAANTVQSSAYFSTIGGGTANTNTDSYAVVPGGDQNVAGLSSFAAGHRAKATHTGAFVWADSTDADLGTTGNNQFLIRAAGGVGVNTNNPGANALAVAGTVQVTGLFRSGSETGTSETPSAGGLVVRRINSISSAANQVIARNDLLTLERDGTHAGLLLRWPAFTGYQTINAMGMNNVGTQVNRHLGLINPAAGSTSLYADADHIVHFQLSFGDTYQAGHMTQVVLDRYDDDGVLSDYYWVGTVTSTFNQ